MDLAYKAATVTDLQRLTADLPSVTAAAPVPVAAPADELAVIAPDRERLFAVMSETRRHGAWIVPQRLDLVALMSDTTIDLTDLDAPLTVTAP